CCYHRAATSETFTLSLHDALPISGRKLVTRDFIIYAEYTKRIESQAFVVAGSGSIDDHVFDGIVEHGEDVELETLSIKCVPPAPVDDLALRVHHVVVFQEALADTKVVFFHFLLGALYRIGDHPVLDDLSLLQAQAVHDPRDTLRHEQSHEVVFERHIELRCTRITLTSRTSAKLTVNAA